MSIHGRNWRSAEREAVVCKYTVDTGDRPSGRLWYFNTRWKREIKQIVGCFMSIHGRNWRSAEREAVVCQYTVDNGDQPNGRLLDVNTQ